MVFFSHFLTGKFFIFNVLFLFYMPNVDCRRKTAGMLNKTITQFNRIWDEDVYYSRTALTGIYQFLVRLEILFKPIRRQSINISTLVFILVATAYLLFPKLTNADMELEQVVLDDETISMIVSSMQNETTDYGRLPRSEDAPARDYFKIPLSAYTSDPAQTDDTPCITASGLDVCARNEENVVAANFLPIGTRVRIPELYGDRVFYVEDRRNVRYHYKMDIWMKDLQNAKTFGVKYATVEVF